MTLNPRQPVGYGQTPYSTCSRCGTERPETGLLYVGDAPPVCADRIWCDKQSGRPTGLDANGDAL